MSTPSASNILKSLSPTRIILPILIGLSVVSYLVIKDFDSETFSSIEWTTSSLGWIFMALLLMFARHFAMMYRIRRLTDNQLSWWQSFDVIALWEFGSAATPSTIGGTAVALFLLTKEKIKAGETISTVMFMVLLDSLFFILAVPLLWIVIGSNLFPSCESLKLSYGLSASLFLGYLVMLTYTIAIFYGLLINPRSFKWLIIKMARFPLFKRWRKDALKTGNDMMLAAEGIRKKGKNYWLAGIFSTIAIWSIRFLILNFVLTALIPVAEQLVLFGRQFLMYVLMLLAPTPGGSGIAEGIYPNILCDFFLKADGSVNKSFAAFTSGIWRLITYYPYLILGVLVLPAWLRRVFGQNVKEIEVK
ncbi:MAG: lysylphosphatidylglycerol synthase transmembrane domain-containing protein [Chitinophagales bacterium]